MIIFFVALIQANLLISEEGAALPRMNGRYSKNIKHFELVVPRKVSADGNFKSYDVKHFVTPTATVPKRIMPSKQLKYGNLNNVNYKIYFNGSDHHLILKPNYKLTKNGVIIEKHKDDNVAFKTFYGNKTEDQFCHFTGSIINHTNSKVAFSACRGLVGYIMKGNGDVYFIEPVDDIQFSGSKQKRTLDNYHEYVHVVHKSENFDVQKVNKSKIFSNGNYKQHWNVRDVHSNDFNNSDETRNGSGNNFYLECMVVADNKFIKHYSFVNVEEYILVLMNIVSDFFHDASLGPNIDVSVVRIILLELEKKEFNFDVSSDAFKTLKSFCNWQNQINPNDESHPNHFDVALLLTRHDFCSNSSASDVKNCDMRGLSYLGTACSIDKNCAVNEDDGLTSSLLIAHNIGHLLSCKHDLSCNQNLNASETNSSMCTESRNKNFDSGCFNVIGDHFTIMSKDISGGCNEWSSCSISDLSNFLQSEESFCLKNEPGDHSYPSEDILYGAVYDADMQCKLQFGQFYVNAPIGGDEFCEKLWCKKLDSVAAVSLGIHVADGTACAHNKWCYNGECVLTGTRPGVVNGGWSSWCNWSKCSRTCGGGVRRRERLCNNPRPKRSGSFCIGSPHQYEMCNTCSCDETKPQFREVQCYSYNSSLYHGELHKWKPFPEPESESNPCSLFCINENNDIVKMSSRVADGTRCKPGSKDTCIQGQCFKVGCDWVIDSDAVEDVCGICDGNGTFCNTVSITKRESGKHGLKYIMLLKRGIRDVGVIKLKPSSSKIVITSAVNDTFYLGGFIKPDFAIKSRSKRVEPMSESGKYNLGPNVTGVYTIPEPGREELHIHGPLTGDLKLHVALVNGEEVFVNVSYIELFDHPVYDPVYQWQFVSWQDCTARCDGGAEMSKPSCVEMRDGIVADKFCQLLDYKPELRVRLCNTQPCKTRWKVWKWRECSGCLFVPGVRQRLVECVKESQDMTKSDEVIVDSSQCCGLQPPRVEICYSIKPCESNENNCKNNFLHSMDPRNGKTCRTNPTVNIACSNIVKPSVTTPSVIRICSSNISTVKNYSNIYENSTLACLISGSCNGTSPVYNNYTTKSINMLPRHKRFHLLSLHHNKTDVKKESNNNNMIVEDFVDIEDTHLFAVNIKNQSGLGLSEIDFELIGDHIPKYVIAGDINELSGKDAFKNLKLLRDNEKNFNLSDSKISPTKKYCT